MPPGPRPRSRSASRASCMRSDAAGAVAARTALRARSARSCHISSSRSVIRDDESNAADVTRRPHPLGGAEMRIEVEDLTKTYPGDVHAVKGISFEVEAGEVFALLGPNGAGKSTTVGMLTTTVRPTSGSARLAGHDVVADPLRARLVSSVVFQDTVLDRSLTGRRNLELHASLWGV